VSALERRLETLRSVLEGREARPVSRVVKSGSAAPRAFIRVPTRVPVLDAATGGGFVRGAVYMVHGAPGAGKSTLVGQAAGNVSRSLYISAEESVEMVAARFVRLGFSDQLCLAERDMAAALAEIKGAPLAIIDSVSTIRPGIIAAGTMAVEYAQANGCAIVLICHENKMGQHAGPRQLEHLIDCTIGLLREPRGRVLVVEKNRFGPAPLAWQLEMTAKGLR
jgi:DNA repair protein RadA/Sms